MPAPGEHSVSAKVMGAPTTITVAGGSPALGAEAIDRLDDLERHWSRFEPESEISRLNRRGGAWTTVSVDTYMLLERAEHARRWTGGLFDPLLLKELEALGYDRDFALLVQEQHETSGRAEPVRTPTRDGPRRPATKRNAIGLDPARRRVRLPHDAAFDPGGIGKGLAADIVCTELMASGAGGALVNVGGDLRVAGTSASGDPWVVAALHPPDARRVLQTSLTDGGMATSSPALRRWRDEHGEHHHLLDPRTGTARDDLPAAVTVLARTGWQAEVLCKAALFADGTHEAVEWVRATGAHIALTTPDGVTSETLEGTRQA